MTEIQRINLLPGEVGAERSLRKTKLGVVVGFVALLVVLGLLFAMKLSQVSRAQGELADVEKHNESLQTDINAPDLQSVVKKQADLQAKTTVLGSQLVGEISWARFLNELSVVIPADVSISTLSVDRTSAGLPAADGTGGEGAGGEAGGERPGSSDLGAAPSGVGTFQVEGAGKCGHTDTAVWIQHVSSLKSVEDLWVDTSSKSTGEGSVSNEACSLTNFSSSGVLTTASLSARSILLTQGVLSETAPSGGGS